MSDIKLPNQVYRLRQGEFGAIPGNPWVYWVSKNIHQIFSKYKSLSDFAESKQGLATADNMRFLRLWWEIGKESIDFSLRNQTDTTNSQKKWFPCMKGGSFKKWYGNQEQIINYWKDGFEVKAWADPLYGNSGWSRIIKSTGYYFKEGITWSLISSKGAGFRVMPPGWIITHKGPAIYPKSNQSITLALSILNSTFISYLLSLISPSIGFETGHLSLLPWPNFNKSIQESLINLTNIRIWLSKSLEMGYETTYDFITPSNWNIGTSNMQVISKHASELETDINDLIFDLFEISTKDRKVIEGELIGSLGMVDEVESRKTDDEEDDAAIGSSGNLALSWLSYGVGIILCHFQAGSAGSLGSAIYRCTDFAIGSLPEPSEEEFNELVGMSSQFAYNDDQGGRHVFTRPVESALQKLTLPDGIAVFDQNHPRDLPTLVSKALELMLGQAQAQEVIQQVAGGDLRKFLEKDFFTQYHIKQYRKRPVYWPVQSAKRSYGFVLFHEKIDRNTFYALQQEPYLPTKRRAVQLRLEELGKKVLATQGAARKPIEKEMDDLRQMAEELAQFAKDLEAITRGGYKPETDWIDDGVILRMAPLWPVIPLWKSEPKKYWDELAAGKYDWSHIAMKYWPERVKQACRKNKSFAIAHGLEEWYQG
jgi:hypothetical protein